jgi:hypothetical protein
MTVGQQAHLAAVIIKAIGSGKAIIFGSSEGGILGLELAAVKPEVIDFLIVHGLQCSNCYLTQRSGAHFIMTYI